jgi:hypothetical protein
MLRISLQRFAQHDRRVRDARLPHRFATANPSFGELGSLCYSSRAALVMGAKLRGSRLAPPTEGAVNVALAHEFSGILRFHAPAVQNPHSVGRPIIGHLGQCLARKSVRFPRRMCPDWVQFKLVKPARFDSSSTSMPNKF